MARYKAVFDDSQADVMNGLADNLEGFEARLNKIASGVDTRGQAMKLLQNQIKSAAGGIQPLSLRMRSEGAALRKVIGFYKNAEKNVIQHFFDIIIAAITTVIKAVVAGQAGGGAVDGAGDGAVGGNQTGNAELDSFVAWVLDKANWTDKKDGFGDGAKGGIDVDNFAGEQCADISKAWYMRMYGVSSVGLSAYDSKGKVPMVNFAAKSSMLDVSGGPFTAGDIGFQIGKRGHTFVILSNPDVNGMVQILEQNARTGSNTAGHPQIRSIPASEITHAYRQP